MQIATAQQVTANEYLTHNGSGGTAGARVCDERGKVPGYRLDDTVLASTRPDRYVFLTRIGSAVASFGTAGLLAGEVREVLVVLAADVFQQIGVRHQRRVFAHGPGLCVGFRVVDRQPHFQMPEVAPVIPLRKVHGVAVRPSRIVQPGARVDPDRIYYKRVTVPLAH